METGVAGGDLVAGSPCRRSGGSPPSSASARGRSRRPRRAAPPRGGDHRATPRHPHRRGAPDRLARPRPADPGGRAGSLEGQSRSAPAPRPPACPRAPAGAGAAVRRGRRSLPELADARRASSSSRRLPRRGAVRRRRRARRDRARTRRAPAAGDRVAVENPGYAALYDLLRAHGLGSSQCASMNAGCCPARSRARSRAARAAVVITPRGQNPTGAALDAERARRAARHPRAAPETLLMEDDHLGPVAGIGPAHDVSRGRRRWAATRSVVEGARARPAAGRADRRSRRRSLACGAPSSAVPAGSATCCRRLVLALWSAIRAARALERASAAYVERREALRRCLADRGIELARRARAQRVGRPCARRRRRWPRCSQRGWVRRPGAPYRLRRSRPAIRITTATLARARGGGAAGRGSRRRARCAGRNPQWIADDGRCDAAASSPDRAGPRAAPTRCCGGCSSTGPTRRRRCGPRPGSSTRATGPWRCASPTAPYSARGRSTT